MVTVTQLQGWHHCTNTDFLAELYHRIITYPTLTNF